MKFPVFNSIPYGPVCGSTNNWPVPNELYQPEQGVAAYENCLEEVEMENELGFDWISCAEHHYSPMSLVPNVSVVASAITQRVKRAFATPQSILDKVASAADRRNAKMTRLKKKKKGKKK